MKALFLVPPSEYNARGLPIDRVYGCNYGFDYKPPIHFLQVATYARDVLGWQVRLLDCPAEGVDARAFQAGAAREAWDVVLHWATYLSAVEDLEAARRIHAVHPETRFVFMGTAPTWKPEEFRVGRHSYCLLGEPEHTLRDLDAAWRGERPVEGIDGLGWFQADGQPARGVKRRQTKIPDFRADDPRVERARMGKRRYRVSELRHRRRHRFGLLVQRDAV